MLRIYAWLNLRFFDKSTKIYACWALLAIEEHIDEQNYVKRDNGKMSIGNE